MTVRPLRALPGQLESWVELEVVSPDATDLRVFGKAALVHNEQRVVHLFVDNNAGAMGNYFLDARIGTAVADYGIFDDDVAPATVVTDPGGPGGGGGGGSQPGVPVPLAFVDDLRSATGLATVGDHALAVDDDLGVYLNAPTQAADPLAALSDVVTPGYSPYAGYGSGSLAEEWDARDLASYTDGAALTATLWLPNRGLNRSGVLLNPGSSGPTLQKNAFGTGRHALRFAGASSQYAEISPDPTRLVGQPFVVFVVAQIVSATTTQGTVYSTGSTAAGGAPNGERNLLSYETTHGLFAYGGGQSRAVTATGPALPTQPHVFTVIHDGQNSLIRIDGTQITAAPSATFGQESRRQFRLGLTVLGTSPGDLRVGHVLIYNTTAASLAGDLTAIENALKTDWGLTAEPPPAAPVIGTATSATAGSATVTWTASSGASSYNLYRSTTSTVTTSSTLAATTGGTSYTDTGLTPGAHYWYAVQVTNIFGTSALSGTANVVVSTSSSATFTDNFTGTAGAALTGRTGVAAGGSNFVISPSGTTTQRATTTAAAATTAYGPLSTSDNRAAVTVVTRGGATSVGAFCRSNLAMDTFYAVRTTSANVLELQKSVAGTVTTLVTSLGTFVAGDVLEVRAVGSTITCYRNGTLLTTVTDTSITTGTYGGLRSGGNATQATLDDLTVADV